MGRSDLRRAWTRAFVIGELAGFVAPAVVGAGLGGAGVADAVLVPALTAAGMVEGLAIGVAQRQVLARFVPAVDGRAWVGATVAAAGFAWLVGMGGGALMGSGVAPAGLVAVALAPLWIAALLAMGWGQWLVLRRTVPRSGRWVPVTAGAWMIGVAIPVVALSVTPNHWPAVAFAAVGLAAAVLMGVIVGSLTGRTLEGLVVGPAARTGTPSAVAVAGDCRIHG